MTTRVTMIQTRIGTLGAVLSAGQSYNIADDLADSLVGSGYAAYTYAADSWERRRTGAFDGEALQFTGIGNVKYVDARWNATTSQWEPRNGRQLIYCAAPVTGASSTTATVAVPQITINAGLLGTTLGLEFDIELHGSANGPTARTITLNFGATSVIAESAALARRYGVQRLLRNMNSAAVQSITNKADGEYTPYQSANSAGLSGTEDTTAAVVISAPSDVFTFTYGTAQTVTLDRYNLFWVR